MTREERGSFLLGRQRLEAGDARGALISLGALARSCPRYADVHYLVGLAHEREGDLGAATESFERALAINPAYAECVAALASVYERRGLFERSRALAARAASRVGTGPGPVDATTRGKLANLHAALGDAYREAGCLREAVGEYRKALDRAPGFHDIRQQLGVALREAGLPGQSVAELKRVLRANPSYLEAAIQLGLTYYSMGRTADAVGAWESVLERDPSRDDARMYLRMVRCVVEAPRPPEPERDGVDEPGGWPEGGEPELLD